MERGFVLTDDRCRTNVDGVYAVGDIVPGLQLAHRGFQQGIFVAEDIAGLAPAASTRPASRASPTPHPEVASVGLTEAQAARQYGAGRDPDLRPRRQRQEPDPQDAGLRRSSSVARTAPVVGVHMVGDRVGELIGEAQLIYNWEALRRGRRPARPRAPDPERSARRGAPRARRQAAARPLLTTTDRPLPKEAAWPPKSPCRHSARASPRAPSPAGSSRWATRSPPTSRCSRSRPTRSTPRSRRRSPARCWRSRPPRTRPSRSAPSSP